MGNLSESPVLYKKAVQQLFIYFQKLPYGIFYSTSTDEALSL